MKSFAIGGGQCRAWTSWVRRRRPRTGVFGEGSRTECRARTRAAAPGPGAYSPEPRAYSPEPKVTRPTRTAEELSEKDPPTLRRKLPGETVTSPRADRHGSLRTSDNGGRVVLRAPPLTRAAPDPRAPQTGSASSRATGVRPRPGGQRPHPGLRSPRPIGP